MHVIFGGSFDPVHHGHIQIIQSILNEPDINLFKRLCDKFHEYRIEFRIGSAGGGNQMRQPYVRDIINFTDIP